MNSLDHRKRLFVDMDDVERQENVTRVFHQAEKYGTHPVLKQEAPWEQHSGMTAAVIFDAEEQIFKAWYMAGHYAPECEHVQCLALSPDGIHWERPSLGIHEALGSKANNIVIPATHHEGQDHWETMLKDPPRPRSHPPLQGHRLVELRLGRPALGHLQCHFAGRDQLVAFVRPDFPLPSAARHLRLGAGRRRTVANGGY